jgi:predicted nucleotidyltransferase
MISFTEQQLTAVQKLCRAFNVQRLFVFGSASTGGFDAERSDLDFLVEYPSGYDLGPWMERHFALKRDLEALFGRPVDLIETGSMRNPYVARSIAETRELLYAA